MDLTKGSLVTKGYKGIYNRYIKRIIDIIMAFFFIIIAIPIYVFISIAILLEDGRPVFYRALRGGYKGKPFWIFKFRTMVKNADKIGGGTTAMHDPRITKIGHVLRKTKMDETANLINIILGTMSFIGPRPELLQYTDKYKGREKEILEVRPGVTDFSSIKFINLDEIVGTENADDMYEKYVLEQKNSLRIEYAEKVSLITDIKIFFLTIIKVLEKIYKCICNKNINKNI
ncbi:MAG: sugar transferase [Dorea sp.]|nr:sugar transferase [Dorea sp.]